MRRASRGRVFLKGVAAGAAGIYFFDPDRGPRRRALARDKAEHTLHAIDRMIAMGSRDIAHRVRGVRAELAALVEGRVPDEVLIERVHSEIGRSSLSHPRAIVVTAEGGRLTLAGAILAGEVADLKNAVERVRGVLGIEEKLEVHESAEGVPALQGEAKHHERSRALMDEWAPAKRLIAPGGVLGVFGAGLALRAIANLPVRKLIGAGAGPSAVALHKTIEVRAPLEEVFQFWNHFENFPRFMEHVKEVRRSDERRSHWVVRGPFGLPIEWDDELTEVVPNRKIAWRTRAGSLIAHTGEVKFEPTAESGTRIEVKMSYNPAAGVLGHLVAALFRVDPKRAMDEDLLRLKSLLEQGKATAHGVTVTREDVAPPTRH